MLCPSPTQWPSHGLASRRLWVGWLAVLVAPWPIESHAAPAAPEFPRVAAYSQFSRNYQQPHPLFAEPTFFCHPLPNNTDTANLQLNCHLHFCSPSCTHHHPALSLNPHPSSHSLVDLPPTRPSIEPLCNVKVKSCRTLFFFSIQQHLAVSLLLIIFPSRRRSFPAFLAVT
jgi:hypothetical protein